MFQKTTFKSKKYDPNFPSLAKIKVVGVGGSGGNSITRMMEVKLRDIELISMNTDKQDLAQSDASVKIELGETITRGLGAGMDVNLGRQAAEENREEIYNVLKGADLVFVVCGMGGGTGTGAIPVVAQIAKQELGILTIGIVTRPFTFEGTQRAQIAEKGIAELKTKVDALITISNDRLLDLIDKKESLKNAFWYCDDILRQAVQGISDLIVLPGIVNVDFADVKAIMKDAGTAIMGVGKAEGEDRAMQAAKKAINSPLLDIAITGAQGVLFNVSGKEDMTLEEVSIVGKIINDAVGMDAKIIFGAVEDETLKEGEMKVTVIATGFEDRFQYDKNRFLKELEDKRGKVDLQFLTMERIINEEKDRIKVKEYEYGKDEEELDIPAFIRKKEAKKRDERTSYPG
jgi:cell division protein FtsZ